MGPEYTCIGIMDAAGKKGFSTLSGHLVPTDMMATAPTKAGNFVRLLNFLADHYVHCVPMGGSVADGKMYDPSQAPPPPAQPKGQIDLLGMPADCPTGPCAAIRPDVASWSMGLGQCDRYFDKAKFAVWKAAVCKNVDDKFIF